MTSLESGNHDKNRQSKFPPILLTEAERSKIHGTGTKLDELEGEVAEEIFEARIENFKDDLFNRIQYPHEEERPGNLSVVQFFEKYADQLAKHFDSFQDLLNNARLFTADPSYLDKTLDLADAHLRVQHDEYFLPSDFLKMFVWTYKIAQREKMKLPEDFFQTRITLFLEKLQKVLGKSPLMLVGVASVIDDFGGKDDEESKLAWSNLKLGEILGGFVEQELAKQPVLSDHDFLEAVRRFGVASFGRKEEENIRRVLMSLMEFSRQTGFISQENFLKAFVEAASTYSWHKNDRLIACILDKGLLFLDGGLDDDGKKVLQDTLKKLRGEGYDG